MIKNMPTKLENNARVTLDPVQWKAVDDSLNVDKLIKNNFKLKEKETALFLKWQEKNVNTGKAPQFKLDENLFESVDQDEFSEDDEDESDDDYDPYLDDDSDFDPDDYTSEHGYNNDIKYYVDEFLDKCPVEFEDVEFEAEKFPAKVLLGRQGLQFDPEEIEQIFNMELDYSVVSEIDDSIEEVDDYFIIIVTLDEKKLSHPEKLDESLIIEANKKGNGGKAHDAFTDEQFLYLDRTAYYYTLDFNEFKLIKQYKGFLKLADWVREAVKNPDDINKKKGIDTIFIMYDCEKPEDSMTQAGYYSTENCVFSAYKNDDDTWTVEKDELDYAIFDETPVEERDSLVNRVYGSIDGAPSIKNPKLLNNLLKGPQGSTIDSYRIVDADDFGDAIWIDSGRTKTFKSTVDDSSLSTRPEDAFIIAETKNKKKYDFIKQVALHFDCEYADQTKEAKVKGEDSKETHYRVIILIKDGNKDLM